MKTYGVKRIGIIPFILVVMVSTLFAEGVFSVEKESPADDPVDGTEKLLYAKEVAGQNRGNINISLKNIEIEKKWVNGGGEVISDTEGLTASFQLYQDGSPYGEVVTLPEDGSWKHAFEELPGEHEYSVREVSATEGYTLTDDSPTVEQTGPTITTETKIVPTFTQSTPTYIGVWKLKDAILNTTGSAVAITPAEDENHIMFLTNPLTGESEGLPTEGEVGKSSQWWVMDAGTGGSSPYYILANGDYLGMQFDADIGNGEFSVKLGDPQMAQITTKIQLKPNGDGSYWMSVRKNNGKMYILAMETDADGNDILKFIPDNTANRARAARLLFYGISTETVTTATEITGYTYTFTNRKLPTIETLATNEDGSSKVLFAREDTVVRDVISYHDLIPNKTYTVDGSLHLKITGSGGVAEDGGAVPASCVVEGTNGHSFVASSTGNGTVTVLFTLDASQYEGESLVAYEEIKDGEEAVVAHHDIQDGEQTVTVERCAAFKKVESIGKTGLWGAAFELKYAKRTGSTYQVDTDKGDNGSFGSLESAAAGKVKITGIGTNHHEFLLFETEAPEGYRREKTPWYIRIENGSITEMKKYVPVGEYSESTTSWTVMRFEDVQDLQAENHKTYTLPSAGGSGTYGFYFIGTFLLTIAGALIVQENGSQTCKLWKGVRSFACKKDS